MAHSERSTEVRNLVVRYGRQVALRGLSATIPSARVTAVVGANGSGKSTLLSALAGVVPYTGTITGGTARPALVVQRSAVADTLPITVWDTVAMGRWAKRGPWRRLTGGDRAVVEDCLARLDIADLANRQLGELSGGQRQRVLVAQGLAQESELLLLDEPASGADETAAARIASAMSDEARRGVTVVVATHDPDAAARADHCLVLAGGRCL